MSGWKYWYGTEEWHTDCTAMNKIINEQYRGYTAGSPLNCDENSTLSSTGGNTKKIYNFQYYHPDWYGNKEMSGAIGSNGYCYPVDYYGEIAYRNALSGGSWAQALATFIDKVLAATGATKVDIVAHSMGGLVARAAIKWYGCAPKVRKLLMIATPNHGIHGPSPWSNWSQIGIPGWMQAGENQEMDGAILFYKSSDPNVKKTWTEFLNEGDWAQGVKYATISGNLDPYIVPSNEDGIVDHEWVVLSGADFNPIKIYAAHGSSEGSWLKFSTKGELSLTACTYTTEFIKNWIIDDDVSHNGAVVVGTPTIYEYPSTWTDYELRIRANINDYNKGLVLLTKVYRGYGAAETLYKAIPIYKYRKGTISDPVGDPVFSTGGINWAMGWYVFKNYLYDMSGLVTEAAPTVDVADDIDPVSVEIYKPSLDEVLTTEGYWSTYTIKWHHRYWHAHHKLWFSPNGGSNWYLITTISQRDSSYLWHLPPVNSSNCKVKIEALLDTFTVISDISDVFTIRLNVPYDLYCFFC
jgi:hypothetical protein